MNIIEDVKPVSEFRQNASEIIKTLKHNRRPAYITVNGKIEAVLQDAASYQSMLDRIEELQTVEAIRRGLDDADKGNLEPMDKAFRGLKKEFAAK